MGSIENRIKRRVLSFYNDRSIPLDAPQVIALSGGADSMALFVILASLGRDYCRSTDHLCAAYYNHNLRDIRELQEEIRLLNDTTASLGISLYRGESPPGELWGRRRAEKASMEDLARQVRYAFLESVREKTKSRYIVLAHHGNDQWETMAARFFQGAGTEGLCGIRPVSKHLIRPLLGCSKADLVAFLEEKGLSWSRDSSNEKSVFQRNKIRHLLLPRVKQIFPGYGNSLNRSAERFCRINDFLRGEVEKIRWIEEDRSLKLEGVCFGGLHPALREPLLMTALDKLLKGKTLSQGRGRRIPFSFIQPLIDNPLPSRFKRSAHGVVLDWNGEILHLYLEESDSETSFFVRMDRGKEYFFSNWSVYWGERERPVTKNVVLYLEEREVPCLAYYGEGGFRIETLGGEILAREKGGVWRILRKAGDNSYPGISIGERLVT